VISSRFVELKFEQRLSAYNHFATPKRFTTMVRKTKDAAAAVEEHPGGGHITVTAQQSRYALDAVDAPASKEVSWMYS
jgi:hypothetical protein